MSTHAMIEYSDENGEFAIYKHFDGYPSRVLPLIDKAAGLAKRGFEAADHATCFVVVARDPKPGAGDIYLAKPGADQGQEYEYKVTEGAGGLGLHIEIRARAYVIYSGPLATALAQGKALDKM